LDVFAAISADHKRLELSVVNPTESAQDFELNLAGVQVAGPVKVWRITAASGPGTAPTRTGGLPPGPPASIAQATLEQMPRTVNLPPASLSVYEFEVRH
jgi:hypothetical protein